MWILVQALAITFEGGQLGLITVRLTIIVDRGAITVSPRPINLANRLSLAQLSILLTFQYENFFCPAWLILLFHLFVAHEHSQ